MKSIPAKALWVAGLLVALAFAGILSFHASSHPDGLEKVAADKGIDSAGTTHVDLDSPLADYQTKGVDNERISGGVAGVVGSVVVLGIAGGLFYALRRRDGADSVEGIDGVDSADGRRAEETTA